MAVNSFAWFLILILIESPSGACFVAGTTVFPQFLACGQFVKVTNVPDWLMALSLYTYPRQGIGMLMIALYGRGYCGADVTQLWDSSVIHVQGLYEVAFESMRHFADVYNATSLMDIDYATNESHLFSKVMAPKFFELFVANDGEVQALPMVKFDVKDGDFSLSVAYILVYALSMRIAAYYLLTLRINKRT